MPSNHPNRLLTPGCECGNPQIGPRPTVVGETYRCTNCNGYIDGSRLYQVQPGETDKDCAFCERVMLPGELYMEDFVRCCTPCAERLDAEEAKGNTPCVQHGEYGCMRCTE